MVKGIVKPRRSVGAAFCLCGRSSGDHVGAIIVKLKLKRGRYLYLPFTIPAKNKFTPGVPTVSRRVNKRCAGA